MVAMAYQGEELEIRQGAGKGIGAQEAATGGRDAIKVLAISHFESSSQ